MSGIANQDNKERNKAWSLLKIGQKWKYTNCLPKIGQKSKQKNSNMMILDFNDKFVNVSLGKTVCDYYTEDFVKLCTLVSEPQLIEVGQIWKKINEGTNIRIFISFIDKDKHGSYNNTSLIHFQFNKHPFRVSGDLLLGTSFYQTTVDGLRREWELMEDIDNINISVANAFRETSSSQDHHLMEKNVKKH
jgi:hypothetical protein